MTGSVQQVDGKTITVSTQDGSRTLTIDDSTQIQRTSPATRADLLTGQTVTVVWASGADAAVTAAIVTIGGR